MNTRRFRRFAAGALCAAAAAVCCLETPAADRAMAQGRNAATLVDFRAFGEDGQPVTDLKAEEVSVRVDGKERAVSSLRFVTSDRTSGARRVPPPFVTNAAAAGAHDVLLLVDDESIAPGREQGVRDAIRKIVDALGPHDRVGLLGVRPGGLHVPLSSDPSRIGDALASMVGQLGNQELACRTKVALGAIASALSRRTPNPQVVVFFSSGLQPPDSGLRTVLGTPGALCEVRATDYTAVASAAAVSRVSFFPILVMDGTGRTNTTEYAAGVEHLAAVVGADTFRLSSSVDPVVARIARDMSMYYVASVDLDPGERSDAPRHLEIRSKRSGVRVRAKPQLVAGKAEAAAGTPRDMLRTATSYRDLPLRIAAYPSRAADDKGGVKVVALFEPLDAAAKLNAAALGFYDDKGTLKAQWTAQPAELAKSPVPAAVVVPAGTYRVRLAATDAGGRAGTADFELQARLPSLSTFRTSALMLGVVQNGAFLPRLQFGADQAAVAVLEIYGVPKSAAITARLEIAETEQGAPLANATADVRQGAADDVRMAFGGFAIAAMPPGDYVVRAIVSVDGKEAGGAVQTLRKVQP